MFKPKKAIVQPPQSVNKVEEDIEDEIEESEDDVMLLENEIQAKRENEVRELKSKLAELNSQKSIPKTNPLPFMKKEIPTRTIIKVVAELPVQEIRSQTLPDGNIVEYVTISEALEELLTAYRKEGQ